MLIAHLFRCLLECVIVCFFFLRKVQKSMHMEGHSETKCLRRADAFTFNDLRDTFIQSDFLPRCTQSHTYTHVHPHTHTHTHMFTHTHTHTHTHTQTYIPHVCTHIHTHKHGFTHTHTNTRHAPPPSTLYSCLSRTCTPEYIRMTWNQCRSEVSKEHALTGTGEISVGR